MRKASLRLEVTPQITPDGNVVIDVDVNKDSVGRATSAGFAIDTKHVKTEVLVASVRNTQHLMVWAGVLRPYLSVCIAKVWRLPTRPPTPRRRPTACTW